MHIGRMAALAAALLAAGATGWLAGHLSATANAQADTIGAIWVNQAVALVDQRSGAPRDQAQTSQLVNDTLVAMTPALGMNYEQMASASNRQLVRRFAGLLLAHPQALHDTILADDGHTKALAVLRCIASQDNAQRQPVEQCTREALAAGSTTMPALAPASAG